MPSSHLILCCPLLLLLPTPPSIRVFPNESTLHMRWPKYWSYSFSISPSMNTQDWSLLRWTGWISLQSKGLLQHHSSKASILWCSAFLLFFFFNHFSFIIIVLLYNIVLVLPYINMNPPWCTRVPHLPPCTIPLGHPSAPAPSILCHASNLDWRFISHMILYMFQCHSPKSSHPHPLPQTPKVCSIHLCLFRCLTYRVIITIFLNSIYMC